MLLVVLLRATPVQAQSFFAESEALQPGSALSLTVSDLNDNSSTEASGVLDTSVTESSLHHGKLRLRRGWFGLGALGEAREFQETTQTYLQRDRRRAGVGYLALTFSDVLSGSDGLLLVYSQGARTEQFDFETVPPGLAFQRILHSETAGQLGLVYRLGPLVAGYIGGRERVRLTLIDSGLIFTQEEYAYAFRAWIAGLILGDPEDLGLSLVVQRKDTPATLGTTIDMEEGFEELRRALLTLKRVQLEFSDVRFGEAFTGDSFRDTRERASSLSLRLTDAFALGATQRRIADTQGFTLLGVASVDRSERTENLLSVTLRF
jgi:hypothetical protein